MMHLCVVVYFNGLNNNRIMVFMKLSRTVQLYFVHVLVSSMGAITWLWYLKMKGKKNNVTPDTLSFKAFTSLKMHPFSSVDLKLGTYF